MRRQGGGSRQLQRRNPAGRARDFEAGLDIRWGWLNLRLFGRSTQNVLRGPVGLGGDGHVALYRIPGRLWTIDLVRVGKPRPGPGYLSRKVRPRGRSNPLLVSPDAGLLS